MSHNLAMTDVKVEDIISLNFEEMDAPNDNVVRREIMMPNLLVLLQCLVFSSNMVSEQSGSIM